MCIELACQNPELVDKMVLIEPPAIRLFISNTPKPKEIISLLFKRPKTAFSIIKFGAQGMGPARKAAKKGEMKRVMDLFGKATLGKDTYERMTNERKRIVLENLNASELTGSGFLPLIDNKLKKAQMPVLLMTGEKSPKVFKFLINRLDELLPNSVQIRVSDASHIIQEDNEEEFINALKSYLN
jgi:pimeloyl-ACP methyl ester carboxylesterase